MKYTFEHVDADDRHRAHYVYTDELGRRFQRWHMQIPRDRYDMTPQEICDYNKWYDDLPVGLRVGGWLTSARTVRSRALDALGYVQRDDQGQPRADIYDPEERDIITDLEAVVARLDNWQRMGKTPKYPGGPR